MPKFYNRLRRNLPNDFPEWVCAILVLSIGILWLVFPASLSRPEHTTFLEMASPRIWTAGTIIVGLLSCLGIGLYSEAPRFAGLIRSLMAIARVTFFGMCVGRSMASSDWVSVSAGILLYGAFIILDGRSVLVSFAATSNAFRGVRRVTAFMVR